MKRIYIAAYHQSKFGKLMGMSIPEILGRAVTETCSEIKVEPSALDVGSVGAVCNISLNQQGLLAGLVAEVPGLAGKPIESVENACASGGQAILSVIQKLQIGWGDTGIAIGYEKMRDADGKMDGKLIGQALGYFSHPAEREGSMSQPETTARISCSFSRAASSPICGMEPAPRPRVRWRPTRMRWSARVRIRCWASVLMAMSFAPWMPSSIMREIVFDPPPPQPMTAISVLSSARIWSRSSLFCVGDVVSSLALVSASSTMDLMKTSPTPGCGF